MNLNSPLSFLNDWHHKLSNGLANKLPAPARLMLLNATFGTTDFDESDIAFLLNLVRHSRPKYAIEAAVLLTGCTVDVIERLIACLTPLPIERQRPIIPLLAGTFEECCAKYLMSILENSQDDAWCDYVILCLSKSDFPVFNIVFFELSTASAQYRQRMHRLLQTMGWHYGKPFLSLLPYIPNRSFFEGVYGKDAIDSISKRG